MSAGQPVHPGSCGDCGVLLDSAGKTYRIECKRLRRKGINARSDRKRRQRDRDLRMAAAAAPPAAAPADGPAAAVGPPTDGQGLTPGEREAVRRAFAALFAAVLQYTEGNVALREAAVAARVRDPEATARYQEATRRMQKVLVATSDAAEAVVRMLAGGDAAGLLPPGRPQLPPD